MLLKQSVPQPLFPLFLFFQNKIASISSSPFYSFIWISFLKKKNTEISSVAFAAFKKIASNQILTIRLLLLGF
jgi:hypothetical protein